MQTTRPRRKGWVKQTVGTLTASALLSLCVGMVAANAQPVATVSASDPTATIARSALAGAISAREHDRRALKRVERRLRLCENRRRSRCKRLRRAARHTRRRLLIDRRRVKALRARIARRPPARAQSPSVASGPSSNFGETFVKGVDANLQGWGGEAPQVAAEMGSLGVSWAREDLSWADVEPERGVFDWSRFDSTVAVAQAAGVTILPIVGYAPSWAGPTDSADYAAFVQAAVRRYGPGTQANLRWWELWNEPYYPYAWSGRTPEPRAYARDVVAAAQAARGVSADVKLLVAADYEDAPQTGGSTPWQTSWIDDMFAAEPSLGQWIDGVSIHPYGDDPALKLAQPGGFKDAAGDWAFQRIDSAREKFLAHGVNVPFWVTEAGWSTSEVSESTQAGYYSDLIPQIAARPWVRALFPYCLREFNGSGEKEAQFGLLRYGSWQPKAAFYALRKGFASLS